MCRQAKARPVCRKNVKNGVILVADGPAISDKEKYRTVWAFGRNENDLEIGRPLLFNDFYSDKGLVRPVTEDIRVAAALQDATHYAESRGA